LIEPAITLSDHKAMYDAKCGRPQVGRGWSTADTRGQVRGEVGKWVIFADVLYGRPLKEFVFFFIHKQEH